MSTTEIITFLELMDTLVIFVFITSLALLITLMILCVMFVIYGVLYLTYDWIVRIKKDGHDGRIVVKDEVDE